MRRTHLRQLAAITAVMIAVAIAVASEVQRAPMADVQLQATSVQAWRIEGRICARTLRCATIDITVVPASLPGVSPSTPAPARRERLGERIEDRLIGLLLEIARRLLFL